MRSVRTNFGRNESGQILIVAPFLILLVFGAFLVAMNVATMSKERMRIQVVSDAAARGGAYAQAQALGGIAILNDGIVAADAQITEGMALMASIIHFFEGLEMYRSGQRTARSLRQAQSAIENAVPGLVEAIVFIEAQNAGYIGFAIPGISTISLDLKDSFKDSKFIPVYPLRIRAQADIKEKIVVGLRKSAGGAIPGNSLLKGKSDNGDLTFPSLYATSGAKPYFWRFGHNPRNDHLSGGFLFGEQYYSMLIMGLGWEAKVVSVR